MNNTTYNQIITAFRNFCTAHKQIKTFYAGQTWNFQTETILYPAIVMLPQPSTIQTGAVLLTFNIFIADILNKDLTNVDEIYSDTLQIGQDIVAYFREAGIFFLNDESVSIEPFEEKFDDVLAGWMLGITLTVPFNSSTCNIPM